MATTEGRIPVGDTGESLDTTVVTQADGELAHREVVVIGDPEFLAHYAKVKDITEHGSYGVHVYNTADIAKVDLMEQLLAELRVLNKHMELITGADLIPEEVD